MWAVQRRLRPGVYLEWKPRGETSHALVRRALGSQGPGKQLKVMHGGALDPFAEGLLPLLVGPAVHAFPLLHGLLKRYRATVRWGVATDTGDGGGTAIAQGDATALSAPALEVALRAQLGWKPQVPETFSNVRVDGERAHEKARRGEVVVLEPRPAYLHRARWLAHRLPDESELELECLGGYYVRALARALGEATHAQAHLTALVREAIGPFVGSATGEPRFVPLDQCLPWLPTRTLSDAELGTLRKHEPIALQPAMKPVFVSPIEPPETPPVALHHLGHLVGLGVVDGDELRLQVSWRAVSG